MNRRNEKMKYMCGRALTKKTNNRQPPHRREHKMCVCVRAHIKRLHVALNIWFVFWLLLIIFAVCCIVSITITHCFDSVISTLFVVFLVLVVRLRYILCRFLVWLPSFYIYFISMDASPFVMNFKCVCVLCPSEIWSVELNLVCVCFFFSAVRNELARANCISQLCIILCVLLLDHDSLLLAITLASARTKCVAWIGVVVCGGWASMRAHWIQVSEFSQIKESFA